ncbi:hypothetical protein ACFWUQ_03515 [Streptomyces sp. NPDC058662]|uniref:hypothetical protein n=1 Tax=Streptomyces sp. NPDC058662 TaxID=3346583 RepID=UPI00364E7689
MKIEVFAHPVSFRRAPRAEAERLRAARVDRVRLAYAYHGGRWLLTTSDPAAVVDFSAGRWFVPRDESGGDGDRPPLSLTVLGDQATTATNALVGSGVAVTAWLVGLHQSHLAGTRPELSLRNAFGHPYRHALCPAQPEVVHYAAALVAETAVQPGVSALELEAFGYLGWQHQGAHDKSGAALRPVDRWLLSLCFCRACSARFSDAGVDSVRAAARTRAAVLAQLSDPRTGGGITEDAVTALGQDLHDTLLAVRADVTTDLVRAAAEASGGLPLSVRATADPYACDGKSAGDLGVLGSAAGGLTVTDLAGDASALRQDLVAAGRTGARIAAGWNLGSAQTRSEGELTEVARQARAHGAGSLILYAYDLAPAPRLEWLRRLPREQVDADRAMYGSRHDRQTEPAR